MDVCLLDMVLPGPDGVAVMRDIQAYDPTVGCVIFTANADGTDVKPLIQSPAYDAEATVSPRGDKIVFTSTRDGDLDLYTCDIDGSNVKRVTDAPGYDGGAFFNWDGTKIVWRAPDRDTVDIEESKALLKRQLVRPSKLEIWIMDADGSNKRMITKNGAANFRLGSTLCRTPFARP